MGTQRKLYGEAEVNRILTQPWWTLRDVGVYLNRSYGSTRAWASRVSLKRCTNDKRLTCKKWVDAALLGKG